MDILLGLVIATGLVYGWARGWVLVALFLTLGLLLGGVFLGLLRNLNVVLISIWAGLTALIWTPWYLRRTPSSQIKG